MYQNAVEKLGDIAPNLSYCYLIYAMLQVYQNAVERLGDIGPNLSYCYLI